MGGAGALPEDLERSGLKTVSHQRPRPLRPKPTACWDRKRRSERAAILDAVRIRLAVADAENHQEVFPGGTELDSASVRGGKMTTSQVVHGNLNAEAAQVALSLVGVIA